MFLAIMATVALICVEKSIDLPSDVVETKDRQFKMPIMVNEGRRAGIKQIRFYVSQDRGKSWQHYRDYQVTDEKVLYQASQDGLYWFALQIVNSDGSKSPAELEDLLASTKVFVNTSGKPVKQQKSYRELVEENEDLRTKVEILERKIKQLEQQK